MGVLAKLGPGSDGLNLFGKLLVSGVPVGHEAIVFGFSRGILSD